MSWPIHSPTQIEMDSYVSVGKCFWLNYLAGLQWMRCHRRIQTLYSRARSPMPSDGSQLSSHLEQLSASSRPFPEHCENRSSTSSFLDSEELTSYTTDNTCSSIEETDSFASESEIEMSKTCIEFFRRSRQTRQNKKASGYEHTSLAPKEDQGVRAFKRMKKLFGSEGSSLSTLEAQLASSCIRFDAE